MDNTKTKLIYVICNELLNYANFNEENEAKFGISLVFLFWHANCLNNLEIFKWE